MNNSIFSEIPPIFNQKIVLYRQFLLVDINSYGQLIFVNGTCFFYKNGNIKSVINLIKLALNNQHIQRNVNSTNTL